MTLLTGVPSPQAEHGRWKLLVGAGALFIVLGLVALGNVVSATLVTTVFVGFLLVVAGLTQVVGAFAAGGTAGARVLSFVLGLLYLFVGLNIVAEPLRGVVLLTIVVSVSLMVGGVVRLVAAFAGQPGHKVLLFVAGLIDVVLGVWLFTGIPVSGIAIGFFLGIDLLLAGITWIAMGWSVRKPPASASAGTA